MPRAYRGVTVSGLKWVRVSSGFKSCSEVSEVWSSKRVSSNSRLSEVVYGFSRRGGGGSSAVFFLRSATPVKVQLQSSQIPVRKLEAYISEDKGSTLDS